MITVILIYFMMQTAGALLLGTTCWDEHLLQAGSNSSCTGEYEISPKQQSQLTILEEVMLKCTAVCVVFSLQNKNF